MFSYIWSRLLGRGVSAAADTASFRKVLQMYIYTFYAQQKHAAPGICGNAIGHVAVLITFRLLVQPDKTSEFTKLNSTRLSPSPATR